MVNFEPQEYPADQFRELLPQEEEANAFVTFAKELAEVAGTDVDWVLSKEAMKDYNRYLEIIGGL